MVSLGASIVRIGTTTLTAQQFRYFQSAISRGFTRDQVRDVFRKEFGIGFSNSTFTAARSFLLASRESGRIAGNLPWQNRPAAKRIPRVRGNSARDGFVYGGSVSVFDADGKRPGKRYGVNFHSDRILSRGEMMDRINDIVLKGNRSGGYGYAVESLETMAIYEVVSDPGLEVKF